MEAQTPPVLEQKPELPDLLRKHETRPPAWQAVLWGGGGMVAIVVGVVLWLTPVLTGSVLFYILGLVMLAKSSERARVWINRQEGRLPYKWRVKLRHVLERFHRKRGDSGGPIAGSP